MNKNSILIIGFIGMVLAQWFVPGQMIYLQEQVLTEGTAYKFKTRPIDPSDPLRGKYINLAYEMTTVKAPKDSVTWGDQVYVYIKNDENGYAIATHASKINLNSSQDYVLVKAQRVYEDTIHFDLPFSTFYMEESKALDAEIAVRDATRDSILDNCYGLVYIKGKRAVLKDVIVNNMSIQDYVENLTDK